MSKEKLMILLAAAFIALIISLPSGHPPPAPVVAGTNDKSASLRTPPEGAFDESAAPNSTPAKKSALSTPRASATSTPTEERLPLPETPNIIIKPPEPEPKKPQITVVYAKRFCGEPPPDADHAAERVYDIVIPLTEGCFAGPITVPVMWSKTKVARSTADGDWASVWCQGHALPSPIHGYRESFTQADFANCGKLSFQGKGSIHLSALDLKKGEYMVHPLFPEAPPQNVPGESDDTGETKTLRTSPDPTPASPPQYDPENLCDDSSQQELHYEQEAVEHFTVTMHDGCWSPLIYVPNSWQSSYYAESVGKDPGWWVAIWLQHTGIRGPKRPHGAEMFERRGPFTRNDTDSSPYWKGWYAPIFRLQGKGQIYFSHVPRH